MRKISSNLMAADEFGFLDNERLEPIANYTNRATAHKVRDDGRKIT